MSRFPWGMNLPPRPPAGSPARDRPACVHPRNPSAPSRLGELVTLRVARAGNAARVASGDFSGPRECAQVTRQSSGVSRSVQQRRADGDTAVCRV